MPMADVCSLIGFQIRQRKKKNWGKGNVSSCIEKPSRKGLFFLEFQDPLFLFL